MIQLVNIYKIFQEGSPDENVLFDHFNFSMGKGDFVSVIGSNGSGKTTLLNLICGSLSPDAGDILFDGQKINSQHEHKRAARMGRVYQDPKAGTCGSMTILENMALADNKNRPYGLQGGINKKRLNHYQSLLEQCGMGLENRLSIQVNSLSGGQRQALALVIANMIDIDLLVLDEHTAALDPKSSETIMHLTQKLIDAHKISTLMVTHNLRYALEYGNRLVMMDEGQIIMDISGKEKQNAPMNLLLDTFNKISIEKGN